LATVVPIGYLHKATHFQRTQDVEKAPGECYRRKIPTGDELPAITSQRALLPISKRMFFIAV
jgi:hypothetical protein